MLSVGAPHKLFPEFEKDHMPKLTGVFQPEDELPLGSFAAFVFDVPLNCMFDGAFAFTLVFRNAVADWLVPPDPLWPLLDQFSGFEAIC